MGSDKFGRAIFLGWLLWASVTISETGAQSSAKEKLCNESGDEYIVCMNCLNAPGAFGAEQEQSEEAAIGAKTLRCAFNSTVSVRDLMAQYSHNNSTKPIQDAAAYCVPLLTKTAEEFNQAIQFWDYKKKDNTIVSLDEGTRNFADCLTHFPSQRPSVLNDGLEIVRARSNVAHSVIWAIQV